MLTYNTFSLLLCYLTRFPSSFLKTDRLMPLLNEFLPLYKCVMGISTEQIFRLIKRIFYDNINLHIEVLIYQIDTIHTIEPLAFKCYQHLYLSYWLFLLCTKHFYICWKLLHLSYIAYYSTISNRCQLFFVGIFYFFIFIHIVFTIISFNIFFQLCLTFSN